LKNFLEEKNRKDIFYKQEEHATWVEVIFI
jgi:hypothetical protein